MAEAKAEADWDHTASLMALLAEINRNPEQRSRPFTPAEFHPLHQRRRPRQRELSDAEAKAVLYGLAGQHPPEPPGLWHAIKNAVKDL